MTSSEKKLKAFGGAEEEAFFNFALKEKHKKKRGRYCLIMINSFDNYLIQYKIMFSV